MSAALTTPAAEAHLVSRDGVAVITLDGPPVNALGWALRCSFADAIGRAADDGAVQAIVLAGAGRGFCAGGDLREGAEASRREPRLSAHLLPLLERAGKPVIAALHGFALGGGLEIALACHARVACADTQVGLPETRRGLLALSGSQRLPRALPFALALRLLVEGRIVSAAALADSALFDRVVAADPVAAAIEVAHAFAKRLLPVPTLLRDRPLCVEDVAHARRLVESERDALRRTGPPDGVHLLAALATLDALRAACDAAGFEDGLARSSALYDTLHACLPPIACQGPGKHLPFHFVSPP